MAGLLYLSMVNLKRRFHFINKFMGILELMGQSLGRVFNYICGHVSLYLEIRRHNTQHNGSSISITVKNATFRLRTLSITVNKMRH
jgi:hypothetical protein